MSPGLAQALQSYAESSAPEPTVVVEEDNGPLGNLIMRPLRALGRTRPVQKAGEGLRWLSDGLNALATKMGVIARGVTKEQAGRQDDQALRRKVDLYRAFEGQQGTPGDEIAARHIAVNTGREFVEDVADVNQRIAEEATREGAPMLAGVVAKKGISAADDLVEGLGRGTRRAATRGSGYRPLLRHPDDAIVAGGHRGRYQAALHHEGLPRLPEDWDVHHSIPQELRSDPRLRGIDIDAPEHLRGLRGSRQLPTGPQQNVHQHISNDWAEFLRTNPNATRDEILSFRDHIDWKYESTFWESQARATTGVP